MPTKSKTKTKPARPDDTADDKARVRAWREFKAGFTRSQRGNLWTMYDGRPVSVFKRPHERDTLIALWQAVGDW
jgi:hypothetical protein